MDNKQKYNSHILRMAYYYMKDHNNEYLKNKYSEFGKKIIFYHSVESYKEIIDMIRSDIKEIDIADKELQKELEYYDNPKIRYDSDKINPLREKRDKNYAKKRDLLTLAEANIICMNNTNCNILLYDIDSNL